MLKNREFGRGLQKEKADPKPAFSPSMAP